jgi:hypothetical protein
MKTSLTLIFIILFFSCKSYKIENIMRSNLTIYRFMYTGDYGIEINEDRFWSMGIGEAEFAYRVSSFVHLPSMKKFIKTLDKNNSCKEQPYYFAFIEDKDTIYASKNLNSWIIKENNHVEYYNYQERKGNPKNEEYIKELLKSEPFLRSWNDY